MPVEFYSNRPTNEVASASTRLPPTDPVETFTRNPDNGKATDLVGEVTTSLENDTKHGSDNQMLRYPSDDTLASLPVEPSELPASETTHLSVDATFDVPAPELAALATPRMPRRSSLKSSNRPELPQNNPADSDATSHTTYTNSENTAQTSVEDSCQTPEFGIATRLSQSPRPLASRKEANKNDGNSHLLRVYEDDDKVSEDLWLQLALESSPPPSTFGAKAVLGERPINTEITRRRNSFSAKTSTEQNINVHGARQIIGRAIPRIKEGTLDQENFKDLRKLIYQDNIWATADEGQTMFDELVLSLAGVLHGNMSYANMDHTKLQRLRLEALYTLKALNIKNKMDLGKWGPRIVRSMVLARNDYPGNPHIVFIMQDFAKTLIDRAEQQSSLDNILKILEGVGSIELEGDAILMAIDLLTLLVARGNEGISEDTESRLGRIACQAMVDFAIDVRMAGTALATKMFAVVKPESRYWRLMVSLSEEHKNLLTYYVSRV